MAKSMFSSLLPNKIASVITLLLVIALGSLRASDTLKLEEGNRTFYVGALGTAKHSKHQWIITKSRMLSHGLNKKAYINGLGLEALDMAYPIKSIQIKIGVVPKSYRFSKAGLEYLYVQNLKTVLSTVNINTKLGYNYFNFDNSFVWPDTGNLIIEICKELSFTGNNGYSGACLIKLSPGDGVSMHSGSKGSSVCSKQSESRRFEGTFNLHLLWDSLQVPPIANFKISSGVYCDSNFSFINTSKRIVNSTKWYFGDGTSDTVLNPTHSYSIAGKYLVKLVTSNQYGSDSISQWVEYIANKKPKPTCMGASTNGTPVMGIKKVEFGSINNQSLSAQQEGNADFTCSISRLKEGQKAAFYIEPYSAGVHQIKMWLDKNGNASIDANTELFYSSSFSHAFSDSVILPGNALLDSTLRLRIAVSKDRLLDNPCQNILNGQFEDYSVILKADSTPVSAKINLERWASCKGEYIYKHQSTGHIDSVRWLFGDGLTSNLNKGFHRFLKPGNYWVKLTAYGYGKQSTDSVLVKVPEPFSLPKNMCVPTTVGTSGENGITKVVFKQLEVGKQSSQFVTVAEQESSISLSGYQDFTCEHNIQFKEKQRNSIQVFGSQDLMDYYVWFDLNNDGFFGSGELVSYAPNAKSGGTALNYFGLSTREPLRIRFGAFLPGSQADPCQAIKKEGEYEDYTIWYHTATKFLPDSVKPQAIFKSGAHFYCQPEVELTDSSSSNTSKRYWYFGDGSIDSGKTVKHTYSTSGDYHVELIAINSMGSDTARRIITMSLDSCPETVFARDSILRISGCKGGKLLFHRASVTPPEMGSYFAQITLSVPDSHEITLDVVKNGIYSSSQNQRPFTVYSGKTTLAPILGRVYRLNGTVETYRPLNNGTHLTVNYTWIGSFISDTLEMRYRCLSYKKKPIEPDFIPENGKPISEFVIYPNPAGKRLFIKSNLQQLELQYSVHTIQGVLVKQGIYNAAGISINHLPSGSYLIQVKAGDNSEVKRFLKL